MFFVRNVITVYNKVHKLNFRLVLEDKSLAITISYNSVPLPPLVK